ncbi:hypothetical protein DPMN_104467 [Dreissena polymorpha]|uniref:Uncharacterized protein n=1 Tax=Dreissena polymorpha TaxID=45954 RepID=A0A9D4HA21_DREPO|nr:hypothetical protein DPMN_104467 [Dreissena polymorpha]
MTKNVPDLKILEIGTNRRESGRSGGQENDVHSLDQTNVVVYFWTKYQVRLPVISLEALSLDKITRSPISRLGHELPTIPLRRTGTYYDAVTSQLRLNSVLEVLAKF